MGKNIGESLGEAYGKNLENNKSDLYADMNEENARKSALKEEQKKALDAYESKKDGESGNLYDDVNKKYELEAEQEKAKEAYESNFAVPKKGSEEDMENKKNEKLRQLADLEKEKRAKEFKKEEDKRQEEIDRVNAYKRQFGEKEDNIDNPRVDNTINNVDNNTSVNTVPVDTVPADNETDLQRIIRERNEHMPDKIEADYLAESIKEMPEVASILETEKKPLKDLLEAQGKEIVELKETVNTEQLNTVEAIVKAEKLENKLGAIDMATQDFGKNLDKKELSKWKKIWKDPKFKLVLIGAIYAGGAIALGATGPASAPLYFGAKMLVAKAGGTLFLPYAGGSSTLIGAAVPAAIEASRWFLKKIGVVKNENDVEKATKEYMVKMEEIKNSGNSVAGNEIRPLSAGNNSERQTINESSPEAHQIDIAGVVERVQMNDPGLISQYEKYPEFLNETVKAFESKISIVAYTKEKRNINDTYKWLKNKQKEIKEQGNNKPEASEINQSKPISREPIKSVEKPIEVAKQEETKEKNTNSPEVISSEVNEMENLIINFKKGETSGKELLEYVQILEELRKKYGDEEAKPLISAIQGKTYSFDEKTREQIAGAMVEYAKKQNEQGRKMKPREVLDYVTYFQNIEDLNNENYKWLMGNEKEIAVGEKKEEREETNKFILGIEIKGLDEVKKMTREDVEVQMQQVHDALNKLATGLNEKDFEKTRETNEDYKKLYNYQQNVLGRQWLETRNEAEKKEPAKPEDSSYQEELKKLEGTKEGKLLNVLSKLSGREMKELKNIIYPKSGMMGYGYNKDKSSVLRSNPVFVTDFKGRTNLSQSDFDIILADATYDDVDKAIEFIELKKRERKF